MTITERGSRQSCTPGLPGSSLDRTNPVLFLILIMICSYCTAEMPEISAFCPQCGLGVSSAGHQPGLDREPRIRSWQSALLATLAYVAALPAVLFLAVPRLRRDSFVRFHCWQSVFFAVATVISVPVMRFWFTVLSLLPGVGFLLAWLSVGVVVIAFVILWIVLVIKAAFGQIYRLPWIGLQAARLAQ